MAIGLKNSGLSGLNKGLFISFEGIDGVGKTTQVEALRIFCKHADLRLL